VLLGLIPDVHMSGRGVRKFQTKDATVAKLFAKHIKIQDSIKFLKSSRTGIAVGTPQRLKALMDDGSLAPPRNDQADASRRLTD
jgi:hypothetical protein